MLSPSTFNGSSYGLGIFWSYVWSLNQTVLMGTASGSHISWNAGDLEMQTDSSPGWSPITEGLDLPSSSGKSVDSHIPCLGYSTFHLLRRSCTPILPAARSCTWTGSGRPALFTSTPRGDPTMLFPRGYISDLWNQGTKLRNQWFPASWCCNPRAMSQWFTFIFW